LISGVVLNAKRFNQSFLNGFSSLRLLRSKAKYNNVHKCADIYVVNDAVPGLTAPHDCILGYNTRLNHRDKTLRMRA